MEQQQQPPSFLFMNALQSQSVSHAPPPKLEDFLGDHSQTETQDSSLTHMYDHHNHHASSAAYFGSDHQDLKAIAASFQAFSTNSGSEVDDSSSIGKSQPNEFATRSIESSGNDFGFSTAATATGSLSLCVAQSPQEVVVAAADSDSSKKVADTFGQRTSIYRGVTR